jgi:TonB family protein
MGLGLPFGLMVKHRMIGCFICAALGSIVATGHLRGEKQRSPLRGFYIATQAVSDAAPFWFDYIIDVRPEGSGVRVREIRIAPLNSYCTNTVTVKAVERALPRVTLQQLMRKTNLCSFTEDRVAAAIKASSPKGVAAINDTGSYGIVAKCGTEERLFKLPYPERVDFKALKRNDSGVARLWGLASDVSHRAFGKEFSFYDVTADRDREFQELGAKLVPDLASGIYDRGFWEEACPEGGCAALSLTALLKLYKGPIEEQDPAFVDLMDATSLHLANYSQPRFPAIAQTARVSGDVVLRISANPQTGEVKDVETVKGPPLLQAAADAARTWRFEPGTVTAKPVEATLRFGLRCPGE